MKEQIEEMAKVIDYTFIMAKGVGATQPSPRMIATDLCDAGYRKQKEGEWKYNEDCDCFVCSVCGNSALNNYRGLSVNSNFCPTCGAHMKGE